MKTQNKIFKGLLVSAILAGGLYASNCDMNKKDKDRTNCDKSSCMMQKGKSHKGYYKKDGHIFAMFKELNLTQEQEKKVEEIIAQTRKNNKSPNEAFSKDGFDKAKYIQIMNEKRDNMIKSKAEIIEKSYAVLTPKQKEQLKVLIDLENEKIDKK